MLRMTEQDNRFFGLRLKVTNIMNYMTDNAVILNNNGIMLSEAIHPDSSLTLRMTKYAKI